MNLQTSVYLDFARFLAAFAVLLHHALQSPFHTETIVVPGRSAVIFFFVISGFVIAHVTGNRERGWQNYAVSRLARIYSVALPALVLTGVLYIAMGWVSGTDLTEGYSYPQLRLLFSLTFANQFWNLTVSPLTNGPYWSLCYEVWYYVLFGFTRFLNSHARIICVALLAILVGPRILLLAPLWLLGTGLYLLVKRSRISPAPQWTLLFLLSLAILALVLVDNPLAVLAVRVRDALDSEGYVAILGLRVFIGGDWRFPMDYAVAVVFACTVYLAAHVRLPFGEEHLAVRSIRFLSSHTFSLYLYHLPLLLFSYAALRLVLPVRPPVLLTISLVVAAVFVLARFTEHRKDPYARFFAAALRRIGPAAKRRAP